MLIFARAGSLPRFVLSFLVLSCFMLSCLVLCCIVLSILVLSRLALPCLSCLVSSLPTQNDKKQTNEPFFPLYHLCVNNSLFLSLHQISLSLTPSLPLTPSHSRTPSPSLPSQTAVPSCHELRLFSSIPDCTRAGTARSGLGLFQT
jgi:hypothetical protein